LHHFDVIVDYTRRSGREEPCGPGMEFPLHHLQYLQTERREITGKESGQDKYDAYSEIHTFVCSAPKCPAVVNIRITPPRLNEDRLAGLLDPSKVLKRGQRVIEENAGRFHKENPNEPQDVIILLRGYLHNALSKAPTELKRIAVQNKKFQLAFSDECDELFEYLDFVPRMEPSSYGVGVHPILDSNSNKKFF
jgi:ubiquitin carboxyl-terminal hydrolase 25/28